jgi:tetratricopeptide (TPR) repeat protein
MMLAIIIVVAGCTDVADTGPEDQRRLESSSRYPAAPSLRTTVTGQEDMRRLEEIDQRFIDGDFDYAVQEFTKYVEAYPVSFKGWNLLGWAYLKTNKLEKAQECFDKSLSINPKYDNAYVGKGSMCRTKGDHDSARKSYLEAISIVPDDPEAYASLLVIELLEGNDAKAVEYGEKAWAIRQDLPGIPANLAVAYHYLGDNSKRDQYYKHAERLGYHALGTIKDIFDGKTSIR